MLLCYATCWNISVIITWSTISIDVFGHSMYGFPRLSNPYRGTGVLLFEISRRKSDWAQNKTTNLWSLSLMKISIKNDQGIIASNSSNQMWQPLMRSREIMWRTGFEIWGVKGSDGVYKVFLCFPISVFRTRSG